MHWGLTPMEVKRTEEEFIGVVEDAAVALGGGTDIDTANGL